MMQLRFDAPGSVAGWSAIDDRVMGGVSCSRLRFDPGGFAVFEGRVATEQGGGFASVRHAALALGGSGVTAFCLCVQGDGQRYKFNLRTDSARDGVQYQALFVAMPGLWQTIVLPITAFEPRWRGRPVLDVPPLDPARVCQVGLMIGDSQVGPFRLAVRSMDCQT